MLSDEFSQLNTSIKDAGAILLRYFGQQLELNYKSTNADYCTRADIETEKAIIAAIERIFPTYNIYAEEHGEIKKGSEYTFIIDPLDGTNNFVLGIPVFTSSVALMKGEEIVYGVIHNPITSETYYAIKGQGAFLDSKQLKVGTEHDIAKATIACFRNYVVTPERVIQVMEKVFKLGVRRSLELWAPAFCYCALASGRLEAIINDRIELYDFAAGKLIAMEAGAKSTDFKGEAFSDDTVDTFVISNGTAIHENLVSEVTKFC